MELNKLINYFKSIGVEVVKLDKLEEAFNNQSAGADFSKKLMESFAKSRYEGVRFIGTNITYFDEQDILDELTFEFGFSIVDARVLIGNFSIKRVS